MISGKMLVSQGIVGGYQLQLALMLSACFLPFLPVDAAPSSLDQFRDVVAESEQYLMPQRNHDEALRFDDSSHLINEVQEVVPALFLDRQGKRLYLTHVDKPLIRKIELLLEDEIRHRNKRDEVKTKKYAAPCYFKICNLGKRRVRP